MRVVVLYCTPSGVLFTITVFSPLRREKKIIKFATDLTFVYFFVLMIDLKMKNVKKKKDNWIRGPYYICSLKFVRLDLGKC